MAETSILSRTEIIISDYNDNNPIVFSNLSLSESLISVNNFSFCLRPADTNSSFSSIIDFKRRVLGKAVAIDFKDGEGNSNHSFKGVILEVNSSLVDDRFYEFFINGSGHFCRVNEIAECHSFYRKTLDNIVDKAFENSSLSDRITKSIQTSKELHYIVQYNQSLFSFMSTLAARYGEWMYYDGENLHFGAKPDGEPLELRCPADVANLNVRAQVIRRPERAVATDIFKSEVIESSTAESPPENDFIGLANELGQDVFDGPAGALLLSSGFNQAASDDMYRLEQQAILSSSVFITGTTRNNKVFIGKKIKIKDATDDAGRVFIITQIQHSSATLSNYSNSFTAVPVEVIVPPYTNPLITPRATPQAAIITDNEDDAGIARVKVRFPWMTDEETTPWISVLVPQAGTDRGFRFLPEIDDEVMVDFWDGNAETPFVNGAVYTEKNMPGIAEAGNHLKLIGTRSGRRLEIDDDRGLLRLVDNLPSETPINGLVLKRKDSECFVQILSMIGDNDFGGIKIDKNDTLRIALVDGGTEKTIISFDKSSQKITISSKGSIDIKADNSINLNSSEINLKANNITIDADSKLKLKGTTEAKLEGMQVKINADAALEAKGLTATVQGNTQVELKGGAMASVTAAIVKIN